MKNVTKHLVFTILGVAFSIAAFGQSDIANASAVIYAPLAITKTVDMDFGVLSVGTVGGTLALSTANALTPSADITVIGGTPAAAQFDVTGQAVAFTFSLPASVILSDGATHTMTIDAFTTDAPATITGGAITVSVGGTLNVTAGQVAGTYTNTTDLEATVNYN